MKKRRFYAMRAILCVCALIVFAALTRIAFAAGPPSPADGNPERAGQVIDALVKAYPGKIIESAMRNGDRALRLRDTWYYYAGGRILPEAYRHKSADYAPQPFYPYPERLPAWHEPSDEEAERYAQAAKRRREGAQVNRSLFFYDDLWDIHNREEAWERIKTMIFLGKKIEVHRGIMEKLALVEQRIIHEAKNDDEVSAWVKELASISAWNWRTIADAGTRSNHAYGIAVDLLPRASVYKNLQTYWLWASQKRADWWNIPYKERYLPPEAVVRAFEAYGFIWGGKWSFFDTMHFEYRPEILILSGITVSGEY